MYTVINSIVAVFGKSLRDGSNLATVVVAAGTIATVVFMLIAIVGTTPIAMPATRVNTLAADREVREWDEAAFAATWAQMRANRLPALTLVASRACDEGCLSLIWPDGTTHVVDLTTALDYAALCACPIVVQSR